MKKLYKISKNDNGLLIFPVLNENIKIEYPKQIMSQIDSEEEIKEVIKHLDFNYHSNFLVFGIRNYKLIDEIRKRKSSLSTLIIIEKSYDDAVVLECEEKYLKKLMSGNNQLILEDDAKKATAKFSRIANAVQVLTNMGHLQVVTCPYTRALFPDFIKEIMHYVVEKTKTRITSVGNDVVDTLIGVQNHVNNLHVTLNSPRIKEMKDLCKGIPAIMVGAGPSLDQTLDELKDIQDKALIFAVDTVTKKLYENGIKPDAMATIERDDIVYEMYYENTQYNDHTVFIGPGVVDSRTFNDIKNAVIIHRLGDSVSRNISEIIDDQVLEIGLNCANVSFAMLKHLGCDPIIMVGQELAFAPDGKKYFNDQQDIYDPSVDKNEPVVSCEANEGGTLLTLKHYSDARVWFEQEVNNDFTNRKYYNCTKGGARIKGTIYKPLSEVAKLHLNSPVKKFIDYYKELTSIDHSKDKVKIIEFFEQIQNDFEELREFMIEKRTALDQFNKTNRTNASVYKKIIDLRAEIHEFLFSHSTMTWIIQSLYFSYDARLHRYPRKNLSNQQIAEIKYETEKYYDTLIISSERLVNEFILYVEVLKEKLEIIGDENA